MKWETLIEAATKRLGMHLDCRHVSSWESAPIIDGRTGTNVHRMQHYWGARTAIEHIREYREARAQEVATYAQQIAGLSSTEVES